MRLPLRLIPAAIAATGLLRRAACAAATHLATLERDLVDIHDGGEAWREVEAAAERHWEAHSDIPSALDAYLREPRRHVCQVPGSLYCDKCQVLNTGRVPS